MQKCFDINHPCALKRFLAYANLWYFAQEIGTPGAWKIVPLGHSGDCFATWPL